MSRISLFLGSMALTFLIACSPKTGEQVSTPDQQEQETVAETPPKKATSKKKDAPCATFSDASDPETAKRNYVLYRDFIKAKDWQTAFDYWQKTYRVAPAADGKRNTVIADGIRLYEHFRDEAQDSTKKNEYVTKIFELYDRLGQCYPEGGYVYARKAFYLYYEYPDRASKQEIYALFKKAIDTDGEDTNDFVINPFASLLVELYFDDKIDLNEAQRYQEELRVIIEQGLEDCEGNACNRWETVRSYTYNRLESFETVEGFYGCDYYYDKYYQEFEDNPQDCDVIRTVISRLNYGGCDVQGDPRFANLIKANQENCRTGSGTLRAAYECLQGADYQCAIDKFKEAAEETDDAEKKGKYLLLVAKIYDAHIKNYPKARDYALQAAEVRGEWGEPYILIGRLYASSGPLCGPGRGWDSQVVTWPAIDAWQKAKRIDPNVASEANKFINQYTQYMPKKEDVFIRNLKAGQSYYVGCWIQRSTTIRTAN